MSWKEEIAKKFPVEKAYDDLAAPATKEVGDALSSAARAARWLIAPIDYLAAQNDRYQKYLERVAAKVPEHNLIEGHPQIVGPSFDHLRYIPDDSIIAEMFVNLLSRSIDRQRVEEAHPAFVHIISQLSPDEAVMIYHLGKSSYSYLTFTPFDPEAQTFGTRNVLNNEFPLEQLSIPDKYSFYMEHLHTLGVAGIWQTERQKPTHDEVTKKQNGVETKSLAQLTPFGQLLAKACVPETIDEYV